MPSIFSRKPWTKCWRDCSPSVTMSTPASSCSFSASMVASALARVSASPDDFQGAHSVLGSASHSGFGSEPAIVAGNSMGVFPGFLIGRTICHDLRVTYRATKVVMAGLVPDIHVLLYCDVLGRRGWPDT